jgi:hypothetical protein
MKPDTHGLFPELEPPRGGPERFAQRLAGGASARDAPHRAAFVFAGAACAAVALVTAFVLLRDPSDSPSAVAADAARSAGIYAAPEFDRLLGRPQRPAALSVTLNERAASVVEIETANEKVRIYRIE